MYKQEFMIVLLQALENGQIFIYNIHERSTMIIGSKEIAQHGNVNEPTYAKDKEVKLRKLVEVTKR